MVEYLFPEDHIVARKKVKAKGNSFKDSIEEHTVTLYCYPVKYDSRYEGRHKQIEREEEWQVEVDVGGFFQESYNKNEESARWSYDLINENFIASVIVWHQLRKEASDYYLKIHEIHSKKVFEGRG